MHRISSIVLATVALTAATGCRPNRGTANPDDYYPLIQVAFEGGEVAAMIGRNEAIKAKDFAGCVASDVIASALDSAGQALAGKLADAPVIPGFDLDLADCMAIRADNPTGDQDAAVLVQGIAGVSLAVAKHYAEKIKGADCRRGTAALAAVAYVGGTVAPITEEIANPDGKLSVKASVIDLKACAGS
jgi:hypothetical protein